MKATELKVETFISQPKVQFIIPVYQRNYDWTMSQCKQLLEDIFRCGTSDHIMSHFIGSIVYIHDDIYSTGRTKELTIIDGQQRLTTITLIYFVLKQIAAEVGDFSLVTEIEETFLINKFGVGDAKIKLRSNESNEKAYKFLLNGSSAEHYSGFSRLIENYKILRTLITSDNYQFYLTGLSKLMFVEISLQRQHDDPQRIFESLNSTGLELTQADLIRNYILMDLKYSDQTRLYSQYWEVIEQNAKEDITNSTRVSEFIRDYLTIKLKDIPNKNKVYQVFKATFESKEIEKIEATLANLRELSIYYNRLLNPANEPDLQIRKQLEYINKLEVNVAFPFLLQVYNDYYEKLITKGELIEVLEIVQSFVWRRFILGLPTNALNKIFMTLYDKIDRTNYIDSFVKSLASRLGSQKFPNNIEVKSALKEKDVYNIKSKNRQYLFERIENFQNNEFVPLENNPNITIEHIFPQNPDHEWRNNLSKEDYSLFQDVYLNTLGNLTLSGNNGKLGNKTFCDKKMLPNIGYMSSRLWINKTLHKFDEWTIANMKERLDSLIERCLQIWKYPELPQKETSFEEEINIFDIEDATYRKLEYAIFLDHKIAVKEFTKLYIEVMRQLFDYQPEAFFKTELKNKVGFSTFEERVNLVDAVEISPNYFIEAHMSNNRKLERLKFILNLFEFQEELIVKFLPLNQ